MDWINLAQDMDRWRALVKAVMNLRVHKMRGISWLAEIRLASQEGLYYMKQAIQYVVCPAVSEFLNTAILIFEILPILIQKYWEGFHMPDFTAVTSKHE